MARTLDSETREALAERMRFYRDLGLTDLYRRPAGAMPAEQEVVAVRECRQIDSRSLRRGRRVRGNCGIARLQIPRGTRCWIGHGSCLHALKRSASARDLP